MKQNKRQNLCCGASRDAGRAAGVARLIHAEAQRLLHLPDVPGRVGRRAQGGPLQPQPRGAAAWPAPAWPRRHSAARPPSSRRLGAGCGGGGGSAATPAGFSAVPPCRTAQRVQGKGSHANHREEIFRAARAKNKPSRWIDGSARSES